MFKKQVTIRGALFKTNYIQWVLSQNEIMPWRPGVSEFVIQSWASKPQVHTKNSHFCHGPGDS